MTQKHTPGPWQIGNRYTDQGVYTMDGDLIANTHGSQRNFNRDEQIAEQDANARLIAAAPELLEALKMARDSMAFAIAEMTARGCVPFEDLELMKNRLEKMDAAIAKAKGENQ